MIRYNRLNGLQLAILIELEDAVKRVHISPEKLPPQERKFGIAYWLGRCDERDLSNHPYVQKTRKLYKSHLQRQSI